jgi:hypothetical protein
LKRLIAETDPDAALAEMAGGQISLEAVKAEDVRHYRSPFTGG